MGHNKHRKRFARDRPLFNRSQGRSRSEEPEMERENALKAYSPDCTSEGGDQNGSDRENPKNSKTFDFKAVIDVSPFKPSGIFGKGEESELEPAEKLQHRNVERVGEAVAAMPSESNECLVEHNTVPPSPRRSDSEEKFQAHRKEKIPIRIERNPKRSIEIKPKEFLEVKGPWPEQNLSQIDATLDIIVPKNYKEIAPQTRYKESLEMLAYYIDPLERAEAPELTLDSLLSSAIKHRAYVDRYADAIDIELTLSIKQEVAKFYKWYRALKYASKGYSAHNYLKGFPTSLMKVDWKEQASILECFVKNICSSTINVGDLEEDFEKEKRIDSEIMLLIEDDNRDDLKELNIHYAATPVIRLIHDAPVTEQEIFEVVEESVTTDYGYFNWLVDKKPDVLLKRADIVERVITAIQAKLQSKDQRPLASLISIVPRMLQSLTDEEKDALAEKYIEEPIIKVGNWCEVLLQGYQMARFKELPSNAGGARKEVRETSCVVTAMLKEAETPEDIVDFLFFCSLISELGEGRFHPVTDHSTDAFCTRMARILCSDISLEKRKQLMQALMLLPQPVKSRLLAESDHPIKTSLYELANKLIVSNIDKGVALKALEILCQHISPLRMVATSIIPNIKTMPPRMYTLLANVMKFEKFKNESVKSTELSPTEICKLAIEQYIEPEEGKMARYPIMEELLEFVDDILAEDVEQTVLDDINKVIADQNVTWYQHKAILEICFPKSKSKLDQPKIPSFVNDVIELRDANLIDVLFSWPDTEKVKTIFEGFIINELRPKVDSAALTFALLVSTLNSGTKAERWREYMKDFIAKHILPEPTVGENIDNGKKEGTDNGRKENGAQAWLKELVINNREMDKTVRDTARKMKLYEKVVPRENKHRNAEKSESRSNASKSTSNDGGRRGGGRNQKNSRNNRRGQHKWS